MKLAVFTAQIGTMSETFVRRHVVDLLPGRTRLSENEERAWTVVRDFLEHNDIDYLDSLPRLREQLDVGIQPYRATHDGHPNEVGQSTLARLVATHLESRQVFSRNGYTKAAAGQADVQ